MLHYGDEVIANNVDVGKTTEETRTVVEEVTAVIKKARLVSVAEETVNVAATTVSTASTIPDSAATITTTTTTTITDVEITLAQTLAELKSAKPKADKVVIQEPEQFKTEQKATLFKELLYLAAVTQIFAAVTSRRILIPTEYQSKCKPLRDNMANENVPTLAPTRSNDQILPFAAWVPTRKRNFILEALEIIHVDQAHQFMSPPSGDAIMNFVNQLGYPGEIHFVLRMAAQISSSSDDLGRTHNIHQRSASSLHLAEEDHRIGNLKFVPKGEEDEVFGMQIPKELITKNIRNAPYYNAYLEMVAKHDKKIIAEKKGKKKAAAKVDMSKKPTTAKQPKSVPSKLSKPKPTTKPKVTQEKPLVPSPTKHPKRGECEDFDLNRAIQMILETFQAHGQAPVGRVTMREQVEEATLPLYAVEGKGKAIAPDEQSAQSLLALHTPKRRNAETGADIDITTSTANTKVDVSLCGSP
ncbi:hypothetical protein Tco_0982280 [Tanacetum coccineum]